ncbi:proteic killer suppression protein [Persephonella hydrogeniphila]|uniref:Proteic killer suppression protein n=1 Tax=Persephonella hydrogeniphila TaxID=198703 RepID=A0A285NCG1_9AQUI|nr:type II toxin-antitoxin system RelE/ParE family toxin [Persephonella hydrogeniphila]SNZ06978.1 proteic killer suppression protein [Persephonella hydrogeniphila]
MIKTFGDKYTKELYIKGKSKKFPPEIWNRALRKLDMIRRAKTLEDLKIPPSNNLEALKGNLKSFYSIRINSQYRIIFKFKNGDAYEVSIVDYH